MRWLAVLIVLNCPTAFAAEMNWFGKPAELALAPSGEHAVRISLSARNDTKQHPAPEIIAPEEAPVLRVKTRPAVPVKVEMKHLRVTVQPDPLTVRVERANGELVQELIFDPRDNSVAFRTPAPVFGLGEGGPQFDRRGHDYPMKDGWGAFERATHGIRVSTPFVIGADGWALFIPSPVEAENHFDLRDAHGVFRPGAGSAIQPLVLYLIDCANPADALAESIRLTGHAPLPPKWALGYMQSHRTIASEAEILGVARTFREKKLPCDALIYLGTGYTPSGWNRGHGSLEFSPDIFENPQRFVRQLHEMNYKVVLHANAAPHTLHGDSLKTDTAAEDSLGGYWAKHRPTFAMGADAWWPDDGDELSSEARLARHRLYQLGPLSERPDARPWSLHRTGYSGAQRYGGWMWSGDPESTWKTLETQIAVGLNHSLSLTPFWGSDTGGFVPRKEFTGELYTRWFQFSAFCPSFRSHGRTWYLHLPWGWNTGEYGPIEDKESPDPSELHNSAVEPICRQYLELRYRLLPYNYTLVREACDTGLPMMRALWLHYPDDPAAVACADEFLWGRDLLVAPVVKKGASERRVYLPRGNWFDWWTGEKVAGGREITRKVDLAAMPLYVRAGAIVPLDPVRQFIAQEVSEPTTLLIHPGADGRFTLYDDDGLTLAYQHGQGAWITFAWNDAARRLTIERDPRTKQAGFASRTFNVRVLGSDAAKACAFSGTPTSVDF